MAYEVVFDETGYQPTSGTVYVIQREIKQLIATHEQLFKRKVPEDFRITYRIFKTQEEFKQHATANGGTVHDSLGGYARRTATLRQAGGRRSPRTGAEVVTWKHELPAMHLAVLLHETTHAVTFAVLRNAPLWVLEGGAGWLGRPAWANDLNAERKLMSRWLIHSLERGELPALRVFLETETYQDWDKLFANERSKGYALSYSLFQYFMSRPDLQAFFTTVLTARDVEFGGQPAKALAANLDKLWAGRLPAIEKGWHNWIRQRAKAEKEPSVKGK